jgi:hypothetical protein
VQKLTHRKGREFITKVVLKSCFSMKIMCCTYERLRDSVNKGILKLRPGQSVQGGEMRNENGRQHGFEYVSSIERMFDEHG